MNWQPLGPDKVKVNFDGAFKASTRIGGIGVDIRNAAGELMGAKAAMLQNVTDPFVVEAMAAIQALDFASDLVS
ncbi:hypothetical protein PTKIN_Ptkin10aG0015200 [Pterospermum kingtungense]